MKIAILLPACIAAGCSEPAPPPPAEAPTTLQTSGDAQIMLDPPAGVEPEVFADTDPTPLTADELVGMWGLRANCGQPTVFVSDGTLTDYTGQTGRWSLSGDFLTIMIGGQTHTNEVNQLNARAFTAGPPEDGSGRTRLFVVYRRC